jgi:hypothetical protein
MAAQALSTGKPWARRMAAGTPAATSLRLALDALFNHPNVGPFIGRQMIQHRVTSHPGPACVARVAAAFNNNGRDWLSEDLPNDTLTRVGQPGKDCKADTQPAMRTGLVENNADLGRPVDVRVLQDGSMLVSDDHNGAIDRVSDQP